MNKLLYPAALLASFGQTVEAQQQKVSSKPNIVFILTDDQRLQGTIHALGGKEVITPNIDKLVKDGVSFTNAYIMGGSHQAVSMPSRNMLITGRNLFSMGDKEGRKIDDKQTTIGEALGKAGYSTYGIGKWHNNVSAFNRTFLNGDEIFFGGMSPDPYHSGLFHYQKDAAYSEFLPNADGLATKERGDHSYPGKHHTEIFGESAVKFINSYKEDKPFFLYVAFKSPHDPRIMPEKYKAMYDTAKIAVPVNFMESHPFDNGELNVRDEKLIANPRTRSAVKIEIRNYYAMMTHLDEQIGNIINALKVKGLYENTIIVFTGDNGLALGQHGLLGKQNLYEPSIKVPLIFVGKGLSKGTTNTNNAYLFDIFPTLCNLSGTPIPATVQGIPLLGKNADKREVMYFSYRDYQRAVNKGDWKLIEYQTAKGVRNTQLFNLKNDPNEMINLAENPKFSKQLTVMRAELEMQRVLYNDPFKINE